MTIVMSFLKNMKTYISISILNISKDIVMNFLTQCDDFMDFCNQCDNC